MSGQKIKKFGYVLIGDQDNFLLEKYEFFFSVGKNNLFKSISLIKNSLKQGFS